MNEPVTITMQTQEWNQVLAILAKAPFEAVASLIQQIVQQSQQGQQAQVSQLRSVD